MQDRDHHQKGGDSRRCVPLIFRQTPKNFRSCARPLCTTCTQINKSLVKVWSNSVSKLLLSWQYQLTPVAMPHTAQSCWQNPCVAPARQNSLAWTCSALPTQRLSPPCGTAHLRLLLLHARLGIQICPTGRFVRSRASASESSIPSEVKLCSLDPSTRQAGALADQFAHCSLQAKSVSKHEHIMLALIDQRPYLSDGSKQVLCAKSCFMEYLLAHGFSKG